MTGPAKILAVDDEPDFEAMTPCQQARQHAYGVPQQRAVGRMMNVSLHHRGVDPQLRTIFQLQIHGRRHHQVVDRPQRCRRQPNEGAVEGLVSRHRPAVEAGELAQRAAVGDPFAQLAIVPTLDSHQDQ